MENTDENTIKFLTKSKLSNLLPKSDTSLISDQSSIQNSYVNEEDVPLLLVTETKTTKCCDKYRSLTIEPFVFCFVFSQFLNMSCLTNMMMDKGCLYYLNYTEEICNNLSGHSAEKETVEIVASNYTLYSNLMQLLGAFQMIFLAPWSDKYGRKLPLFLSVLGMVFSDVGLMMCSIYFDSPLYVIILTKIPSEIFGGFICTLTTVYSHASEVSSVKTRAMKYAFVEIASEMGKTLGGLVGGLMYKYGYVYIFLAGTVMHLICLPWIVLVVQETTGLGLNHTWREKMCNFFAVESVTKGWKTTFRRRENNGRAILLLFFASMCVIILTILSLNSIGFIYIHHLYNWDQGKYSVVNTIFVSIQMVFLIICMPLLVRRFKVSDAALGLTGAVSMMWQYALIAFAQISIYIFYLGNIVGCMGGLTKLLIRSGISKLADKDELGQVFSFLATCEAIIPMIGTIFVTKVFNATMDIFPSVTYLMTVGFLLLPLFNFAWLYLNSKRNQGYQIISTK